MEVGFFVFFLVSSCVFHCQKLVGLGPAYPVDDHHVFLKVTKLKPPKNHTKQFESLHDYPSAKWIFLRI